MELGKPQRVYTVEPAESPVPARPPATPERERIEPEPKPVEPVPRP